MSFLNFTSLTLPSIFKQKETLEYPIVKKEPYDGLKGKIAIDENNCILCGKCSRLVHVMQLRCRAPIRRGLLIIFAA